MIRRLQHKKGHRRGTGPQGGFPACLITGLMAQRPAPTIKWRTDFGEPRSTQGEAVAQMGTHPVGGNELQEVLGGDSGRLTLPAGGGHTCSKPGTGKTERHSRQRNVAKLCMQRGNRQCCAVVSQVVKPHKCKCNATQCVLSPSWN